MTGYFFCKVAMRTFYHQCFNVINISEFVLHLLAQFWECTLNASKWYSFMRICHENNFKSHLSIFRLLSNTFSLLKMHHVIKSCNLQNGKTQMICMNSWWILCFFSYALYVLCILPKSRHIRWKMVRATKEKPFLSLIWRKMHTNCCMRNCPELCLN